ncbi:hypothetical protein GGR56DRAFT_690754 [Xylariaceae sp. FL0804]|nr:hypothetical protein GGR56DRAFT_690754 [Xylariaceae sp. FL0804]
MPGTVFIFTIENYTWLAYARWVCGRNHHVFEDTLFGTISFVGFWSIPCFETSSRGDNKLKSSTLLPRLYLSSRGCLTDMRHLSVPRRRKQNKLRLELSRESLKMDQRKFPEHDLYQVLGLSPDATQDLVRKTFLELSLKHHPDKAGGSAENNARFARIREAYEILHDPEARAEYDRRRSTSSRHDSGAAPSGAAPSGAAPSGAAPSGAAPSGAAPAGGGPQSWTDGGYGPGGAYYGSYGYSAGAGYRTGGAYYSAQLPLDVQTL